MTKNEDLKSCPFCGEKLIPFFDDGGFSHAKNSDCIIADEAISPNDFDNWNTRPTVTPADGDAERALEAYNGWVRDGQRFTMPRGELTPAEYALCEAGDTIISALQTRTPPLQEKITVDISGIDNCMKMDAVTSIKILRELQGKIYRSNEIGWVIYEAINNAVEALKSSKTPVPVDTIAVPREVLQGVKSILIRAYPQIAYDDEGGLVTARHSLEIVDGMQKTLASLDAVLAEGE